MELIVCCYGDVDVSYRGTLVCQVTDSLLRTDSKIHWYDPTRLGREKERERSYI